MELTCQHPVGYPSTDMLSPSLIHPSCYFEPSSEQPPNSCFLCHASTYSFTTYNHLLTSTSLLHFPSHTYVTYHLQCLHPLSHTLDLPLYLFAPASPPTHQPLHLSSPDLLFTCILWFGKKNPLLSKESYINLYVLLLLFAHLL